MLKRIIASSVFFVCAVSAFSQIIYSNHPASIKWKRIETSHLRIIYPQGLDSVAQLSAAMSDYLYGPATKTLKVAPRKISLVLYNQTVDANGFVTPILPLMGWYTTPPQDMFMLGSGNWLYTLAVHEYRHVAQFEKMNQNATNNLKVIAGSYGAAAAVLASHPIWFAEGDAVLAETALSSGGRGRMPCFSAPMRAIVLEGRPHSYDKTYARSYKMYYPNHYALGYQMVAHGRNRYGEDIWPNVLDRTSKNPILPWQFSRSMRKETKLTVRKFYNQSITELTDIWKEMEIGRTYSSLDTITKLPKKSYTLYQNPLHLPSGEIFALKRGFSSEQSFVAISGGKERHIMYRSPIDGVKLSGNMLVWNESISDIRYGERSYADIFTHNLTTGKTERITKKGKFFSPVLSPCQKFIAAVEFGQDAAANLSIIETSTGQTVSKIAALPGQMLRQPHWYSSDTVFVIASVGEQNSIECINIKSGLRSSVYGPVLHAISGITSAHGHLLYGSVETGLSSIHALDLSSGKEYLAAQSRFGAYDASVDNSGQRILLSVLSSDGRALASAPFSIAGLQPINDAPKIHENYFQAAIEQEQGGTVYPAELPLADYQPKPYRPTLRLFNPHSWLFSPNYYNGMKFTVYSDDILGQMSAYGGFTYSNDHYQYSQFAGLAYSRFFPIVTFEGINGRRLSSLEADKEKGIENNFRYSWLEQSAEVGIKLPFNFSRAHRLSGAELGLSQGYAYLSGYDLHEKSGGVYRNSNGTAAPVKLSLLAAAVRMPSVSQIQPRLGAVLSANSEHPSLIPSSMGSKMGSVSATVFLPSFMPRHGISASAAYEHSEPHGRHYKAKSYIPFARGYDRLFAHSTSYASGQYSFPLFYPDFGIPSVVHFKRLRGNVFADYTSTETASDSKEFISAGAELHLEFNLFRWVFLPLEIGLRCSYTLLNQKIVPEIVLMGASL
jgi:hypothetical protein